jgi:hypothetical protein
MNKETDSARLDVAMEAVLQRLRPLPHRSDKPSLRSSNSSHDGRRVREHHRSRLRYVLQIPAAIAPRPHVTRVVLSFPLITRKPLRLVRKS